MSLYLVLPGCLCQVLLAFGIESESDGSAAVVSAGETPAPLCYFRAPGEVPSCHCDEEHTKTADANLSGAQDPAPDAPTSTIISLALSHPFPAESLPKALLRGPPLPAPWTAAPRSGVFLI